MPSDPRALLRSRAYLRLLVIAAALGVPVSAAAYGFLALVGYLQPEIFTHLPHGLGFQAEPVWWPLPVLAVGGVLTGLAIRYLPGTGGAHPAEGFKTHRAPTPAELPGVILAALATLIFGAVLGPEAPLIAIGGGLVVLALRAARRDVPDQATAVLASAGSFAAISTLLGSPIIGAFLLMEASGDRCWASSWCPACWPRASARSSSSGWTPGPGWAPSPWPSRACPISARQP